MITVRGERGTVIIWFAMVLLLLLSFVALGVDVAKLAATRSQLQNAADAAALAGASAIDPETGLIDEDIALSRAIDTGSRNQAYETGPTSVTIAPSDVAVLSQQRVRVVARRQGGNSMVAQFAQVLGLPKFAMTATATARAETTSVAECGIVPLGVNPPPGGRFIPGCGNTYVLKSGGGGGTGGNYGALNLPDCKSGAGNCGTSNGASRWSCLMKNGYCCDVAVGQALQTQPGNMSGPFKKAIDDRFAADHVKSEDICYETYSAAGGTGQRVIYVPIVTTLPNGVGTVTATGFAAFFIRHRPGSGSNSTLEGEFIHAVIPGEGGGHGNGGPVTYSLHLVPND